MDTPQFITHFLRRKIYAIRLILGGRLRYKLKAYCGFDVSFANTKRSGQKIVN